MGEPIKLSPMKLFLYRLRSEGDGVRAIYIHMHAHMQHMHAHGDTHTRWLRLAAALWSEAPAKSEPSSGTLGVLCLVLGALALARPRFKIHCGFEEQHSQQ